MNTGDSLIAISVDLEDIHGGFGFGFALYSPRVTRSVSNLSTASSEDQISICSSDRFDVPLLEVESTMIDLTPGLPGVLAQSPSSNGVVCRTPGTPKDATNTQSSQLHLDHRTPIMRERHASTGKENQLSKQLGSPKACTEVMAGQPSRNLRAMDVYNFEGFTPKKSGDSTEVQSECLPRTSLRHSLVFQQGSRMHNGNTDEISLQNDSLDSQPLEDIEKSALFEKPVGVLRIQNRESPGNNTLPKSTSLLSPSEGFSLGKGLCISPAYGKFEGGSSTCSSCVSSPIILQSDSQCFTYSVRRYIDFYNVGRPDSPTDHGDVEGKIWPNSVTRNFKSNLLSHNKNVM